MKRIIVMLTLMTMLVTSIGFADRNVLTVKIDNNTVSFPDAKPFIDNGRTLIPVRVVSENLGATVNWDAQSKVVSIVKGTDKISLTIDMTNATKNGATLKLDAPATIKENRTFVPLRFVSEGLGAKVEWIDSTKTVQITTTGSPVSTGGTAVIRGETVQEVSITLPYKEIVKIEYSPEVKRFVVSATEYKMISLFGDGTRFAPVGNVDGTDYFKVGNLYTQVFKCSDPTIFQKLQIKYQEDDVERVFAIDNPFKQ